MKNTDKRRSRRKRVRNIFPMLRSLNLQDWNNSSGIVESSMQDLNLSGACVNCENIFPVGTCVSINLMLHNRKHKVKIFGKVIWVLPEDRLNRTGIKFSLWKNSDDRKLIVNFWEKLSFVS